MNRQFAFYLSQGKFLYIDGIYSCIAGDFISTKSQNEVIAADVKLEKEEHFVHHREAEVQQVKRRSSSTYVAVPPRVQFYAFAGARFFQRNAGHGRRASA